MDINDTRFYLKLRREEWLENTGSSLRDNISWDFSTGAVTLTPRLFRFPTPPGNPVLTPENRRGADRDRYGNWYWISEDKTEIRTLSLNRRRSGHFWQAEDMASFCIGETEPGNFQPVHPPPLPAPLTLSGLAVNKFHYLTVGVMEPAGLLVFDLHAGGPPMQLLWPEGVPFVPFDMAAALDGGVWILDSENANLWKLDRYFRVKKEKPTCPIKLTTGHAVSIEAVPDGSILIMDSNPGENYSTIYRCVFDGEGDYHWQEVSMEVPMEQQNFFDPASPLPPLIGHDMAFVPNKESSPGQTPGKNKLDGILYISDPGGDQSFAFHLLADEDELTLELQPYYFPMRFHAGKALTSDAGKVYYDMKDRWLPLIRMPRPSYHPTGRLTLPYFDGKEPGCVWHRLFIDACIPPGTYVRVESRVSDQKDLLDLLDWQEEPPLYCRGEGAELPYYYPFAEKKGNPDGLGTWELLFREARGRYMQLRLTISGPGNMTPHLYALRVYYPRFSYLQEYLPGVYRENEISASFLERFLANMEGLYTTLEGKIAEAQALFDVESTPAEYLDWLAGWFGVVMDPAWDDDRRRLFLRHAIELFNQRGTPLGLIRAIRLAVDPCPDDSLFEEDVCDYCSQKAGGFSIRIIEEFLTRSHSGVIYGDPTAVTLPGIHFSDTPWTPAMGAETLHLRYRLYLEHKYGDIDTFNQAWQLPASDRYAGFQNIFLPPVKPRKRSKTELRDWQQFLQKSIGFTYQEVDALDYSHLSAYRNFLARRYQLVERLHTAYGWTTAADKPASFSKVKLPEEKMPSDGQPLKDWIQFVSQVMPVKEKAHRFVVLVPIDPAAREVTKPDAGNGVIDADMETMQQDMIERVEQVVKLEKPAHTDYRVKAYWALFRVGTARVGIDTLPGYGSRYTAILLGKSSLAKGYLTASHPWNVRERTVLGRDAVGERK